MYVFIPEEKTERDVSKMFRNSVPLIVLLSENLFVCLYRVVTKNLTFFFVFNLGSF